MSVLPPAGFYLLYDLDSIATEVLKERLILLVHQRMPSVGAHTTPEPSEIYKKRGLPQCPCPCGLGGTAAHPWYSWAVNAGGPYE